MTRFSKKVVFLTVICLYSLSISAQYDFYRSEIGLESGIGNYFGDANSVARFDLLINNTKNVKPILGIDLRYKFNSRLALHLGYNYAWLKGSYKYAEKDLVKIEEIDNNVHFIDLWGEYNFFELNLNPYKRFDKKISPFIFLGIGQAIMPDSDNDKNIEHSFTIPFGVGIKLKLKKRWNFNIRWTNRLFFSDNLEVIEKWNNPTPKTVFNPMNSDVHTAISVGFSYDFWLKGCDCNQSAKKIKKRYKK